MWEQQNIEGGWDEQRKATPHVESSFEKYHRESEESRAKQFKLSKEMAAGNRPMFMTGPEIKQHYAPLEADKHDVEVEHPGYTEWRNETDNELWDRKLTEAKQRGGERYGEMMFHMGIPQKQGITQKSTLADVVKKKGFPGHVSVEDEPTDIRNRQILGGHHRVALAAAQFPEHLLAVKHYSDIDTAKEDPQYR